MKIQQEYKVVGTTQIQPHPDNPRKHALLEIESSIDQNGWYGAIIVQKSTNHILAGHGSYQAAKNHGAKKVPVLLIDVDDETAKRILLGDNRIADLSGYDEDKIMELLEGLESLEGTGYDELAQETGKAAQEAPEGGEGEGDVPDDVHNPQFGIIVTCESESEQEETYAILKDIVDSKRLRVVAI
jgi:hypothetical protein